MANKIIHDLTQITSAVLADEIEIQKLDETVTKRATLSQVKLIINADLVQADLNARNAGGWDEDGTISLWDQSWYLKDADFLAGFTDMGGLQEDVEVNLVEALRMLDAKIHDINIAGTQVAHASCRTGDAGIYYAFGFYEAPQASKAFTQAAATQTLGSSNNAYGAHVFIVASAAGSYSGGTGAAKLTITGTSITDTGVRVQSDVEILVADVATLTANKYVESNKKWIGEVTITLAPTATHSTYAVTCNYGLACPYAFNESNVRITAFDMMGKSGASDAAFNVQLLQHSATGWTYSAADFDPQGTVLADMNTDLVSETNLVAGVNFAYKRKGLLVDIDGLYAPVGSSNGIVVKITTSNEDAVESSDINIYFQYR